MTEKINTQSEKQPILVRRTSGEISVMNPTDAYDQHNRMLAEGRDADGNVIYKPIGEKALSPQTQKALAWELAMDRPGLTMEQLERNVQPYVEEDLGEAALDAAHVEVVHESSEEIAPESATDQQEVANIDNKQAENLSDQKQESILKMRVVVEDLDNEVAPVLGRAGNAIETAKRSTVSAMNTLEDSSAELRQLALGIESRRYSLESARAIVERTIGATLSVSRRLELASEQYQDIPKQLDTFNELVAEVNQKITQIEDEAAASNADAEATDVRGKLHAIEPMVQEISIVPVTEGLNLAKEKTNLLSGRLKDLYQSLNLGRIDTDELRVIATQANMIVDGLHALPAMGKTDESIGALRVHVRRIAISV